MQRVILYLCVTWYGLKSKLIYGASSGIELIGKLVEVMAQILVWTSLLTAGSMMETSLQQMITYILITRVVTALVSSTAGEEISQSVVEGTIGNSLVRPMNMKAYYFFADLGNNVFKVAITLLPVLALFASIYGFVWPNSIYRCVAFMISLGLGIFIMFHYNYILGLITFWLIRNPFLRWHFRNVEVIFSGQFFPIWFYPDWLAKVTLFLPFRYFTYEPLSIYLSKTPENMILWTLLTQLTWAILMYVIERVLWHFAQKRVIIQGG